MGQENSLDAYFAISFWKWRENFFFPFNLNEVDALHLKFINVVKAIPGENTGAVFP